MKKEIKKVEVKKRVDAISLKNAYISILLTWLSVPLHSEKARARNRIVEILAPRFKDFEKERMELIEKYGEKDDKKKLIMIPGVNGGTRYSIKDQVKFNEAFDKIKEVEVVFDILPSNRENWKIARKIIEDTKMEMDVEVTNIWEKVLEILKEI